MGIEGMQVSVVWVFDEDRTVTAVFGDIVVDLPQETIAVQVDVLEPPKTLIKAAVGKVRLRRTTYKFCYVRQL